MRLIVILTIAVLAINASFAQGTSYKGDWCSFDAPGGYSVFSEDDITVVLQKVISSDLVLQLSAVRVQDVNPSNEDIQTLLNLYVSMYASSLQDSGVLGTCTSKSSDSRSGLQGWTAIDVRYYRYPHADILSYGFRNSDDFVVLSAVWIGADVLSIDVDTQIEPVTNAYNSFRYYD